MAVHFHVRTSDSMPERLHVTEDLERRFKQQEEAEQAVNTQSQSSNGEKSTGQRQ
jgi:hypothetical protein